MVRWDGYLNGDGIETCPRCGERSVNIVKEAGAIEYAIERDIKRECQCAACKWSWYLTFDNGVFSLIPPVA